MDKIINMQENLLLIRRTVGWTAKELGDRVGVTRQTINLIESKKHKLTKTLYLAIRDALNSEIVSHPSDTNMLYYLLVFIVDHPDKYKDDFKKYVVDYANMIAPSILSKSSTRREVSDAFIIHINEWKGM